MHVDDFLTYIQRDEDRIYLRSRLLPVSMRLFQTSLRYRHIVLECCEYLRSVALSELEGYSRPYGTSGANLALPFNIVGVVVNRGTPGARCHIMINPEILEFGGPLRYVRSNCGSVRLEKPLEVQRYSVVRVRYWDEQGHQQERIFDSSEGSYTIQHEVDHNLGVLITDYGRIIADEHRTETQSPLREVHKVREDQRGLVSSDGSSATTFQPGLL
jgi:peptide deformylase